ncbi:MAG: cytochrome C [Rickettsiales bacterium]|nr:cytochrome C [Rickettsiales bacterium]|tara:strand:- start:65 stop:544 length:480 start_codon:yes stop_codon:yes gene_type:complete
MLKMIANSSKILLIVFLSLFNNFVIASDFSYGLSAYKKANCMGCHSWHGKGGGGYGAGVSLRITQLDRDSIIEIIKCGKPGTGMPYFYKKSYIKEKCYDTLIEDYQDGPVRPISSKKFVNDRQVEALADFIVNNFKGKKLTKEYCEKFFKKGSRVCDNL